MSFILVIYQVGDKYPESERFGLIGQMRRAAVSIASNIAEGAAHQSTKDFIRYLYHALGSAAELETQLEISIKLGFIPANNDLLEHFSRIRKMLIKLINSLKTKLKNQ